MLGRRLWTRSAAAGLHAGEVERRDSDVAGTGVHIGARVSALAGPGEVLVTSTVKDLIIGSDLEFSDRGARTLKGSPRRLALLGSELITPAFGMPKKVDRRPEDRLIRRTIK